MPAPTEFLAGRNSVREVLLARRRKVSRVLIAQGITPKDVVLEISQLCQALKIPQQLVARGELERLSPDLRHQGIMAEVSPYPYVTLEQILAKHPAEQQLPLILILDDLQDPQNVGSLLRTAEAVGVSGVVVLSRRAVGITPAVSRASAGAVEHLAISEQTNLASTLRWLKERGIWVVGVEEHVRAQDYRTFKYDMPLALVVGSEGSGMRRLTIEECDFLVSIPMIGRIHSLNASVAGSLVLYQAYNSRRPA